MDDRALFAKFWEDESKTTRNVIARIPEGSNYRPDPKSRTASEIAWQIVCEEKMIIDAIETGKADWSPSRAPATMKELLDIYDEQSADVIRRWKALPPHAGRARSISSAVSDRRRRWHGASCSTSCTIEGKSPRTCAQWGQPSRRSMDRARTSRRLAPIVAASYWIRNHAIPLTISRMAPVFGSVIGSANRKVPKIRARAASRPRTTM